MWLREAELQAAVEAARRYPPGHGSVYLAVPAATDDGRLVVGDVEDEDAESYDLMTSDGAAQAVAYNSELLAYG